MEFVHSKSVQNPDSYHNAINVTEVKIEKNIWNESEAASNNNSSPCIMQGKFTGFSSFASSSSNGSKSLEEQLLQSIRPECKIVVDELLEKIRQLSLLQKMLLYLKLPPSTDDPDKTDTLRKPLNPLGSRSEVNQALAYIRSHFLPDPDVSLPKKDIYNEYMTYCLRRKTKPLSMADFGKAMKQVYPVVRPRRLGERGNSRYCYSGLRNREQLNNPSTPQFPNCQARNEVSRKICTWASGILKTEVKNLKELSSIISFSPIIFESGHVEDSSSRDVETRFPKGIVYGKHKLKVEGAEASQSNPAKKKKTTSNLVKCESDQTFGTKYLKLLDLSSAQSPQNSILVANSDTSNICDIDNQKQTSVDSLEIKNSRINCFDLKSEKSTNVKQITGVSDKKPLPLKITQTSRKDSDTSRLMRHKPRISEVGNQPVLTEDNFGIASIVEESLLEVKCSIPRNKNICSSLSFSEKPALSNNNSQLSSNFIRNISVNIDTNGTQDCDQSDMYNDDLGCLTTESLHDYLQDEGNSQEPEEELLKYFKDPIKSEKKEYGSEKNISQLRLLLEQDNSEDAIGNFCCQPSGEGFSEEEHSKTKQKDINNYLISNQTNSLQPEQKSLFTAALASSNCKRRVSFENIPDSFPKSPNILGKNFSFTPISPRPPTISKSNLNLSPFVFPRDTVFRGKLSTINFTGNSQPQPAPSPVLQATVMQMSPLKSLSQSISISSTPSPIINNCSSSSSTVLKGRSTPQDTNQEQMESLKYSPLISPSSSSGVFLSPASPMSSCNSPVFSFRKSMSPVKLPDDSRSLIKPNSSLLQSLLLTGKCSEINISNKNERKCDTVVGICQNKTEPIAVDVSQFSTEHSTSFRSRSVPTLTSSEAISPKSNTLPFPVSVSKNKKLPSLEIKPSELYVWDSILNGYKRAYANILTENSFENNSLNDDGEIAESEESMETVISNLCEFLNDNDMEKNNATESSHISRSQPNTPLVYSECSNSSRDPVVSALPLLPASKSYPSTPTACTSQIVDTANWSAKRNIIPLLDNLSIPGSSFSDDMELHLNNLTGLSSCDDTFSELAQEVSDNAEYKELR